MNWMALCLLCTSLSIGFALPQTVNAGPISDVQLSLQLSGLGDCKNKEAQVWIAQERNLLYQVEVPVGGNARFHLIPGKYSVVANTEAKCFASRNIELKDGDKKSEEITLTKSPRSPANFELGNSSCMCITAPCPCDRYRFPAPNYIQPAWYPWWMYYGSYYPNFYYPAPWMNWGMNPGYYPGSGHVGLAKPNVYITSAKPTTGNLQVTFDSSQSNWLATIPSYSAKGWNFQTSKQGSVISENINYPYLYYDLRVPESTLQDSAGACAERTKALEKMVAWLKESGFRKNEIRDFEVYWRIKLPPGELCVYPQSHKELDPVAQIQLTPVPKLMTRVVFMVMQKEKMSARDSGHFRTPPTSQWQAPKPTRLPSSASDLELREWGVAFGFEPSKK